jgi:type I restriction enzyme S subunit
MTETVHRVSELEERGWLLVEDGNHGEYRPRSDEFGSGIHRFIRASDMDGGQVLFGLAERINDVARARIRKGVGAPGDILFSHKGTVGKVALVPSDAPPFVCSPQTTFWRTLDETRIDRRYLYYFMCSAEFTEQWAARKDETDMAAYVSLTAQRELHLRLPSARVQQRIADVLGALDDKIALNRRTSQTLENLATTLFKSWFIDFGPVQAKRDGRHPVGVPALALPFFPEHFQDTDLGPIPKGWRVTRLGDVLELKRGYDLPARDRTAGRCPIVSSSGPSGTHAEFKCRGPGVVTGRYGTIGEVFYVDQDFWPLNTTLYVRDFKRTNPLFAYHLLKCVDLHAYSDKAAVPGINRNDVHLERVVEPPSELLATFADVVQPMRERMSCAERESVTLASLRDLLLPALLAGEVTIKQAERAVAEVA